MPEFTERHPWIFPTGCALLCGLIVLLLIELSSSQPTSTVLPAQIVQDTQYIPAAPTIVQPMIVPYARPWYSWRSDPIEVHHYHSAPSPTVIVHAPAAPAPIQIKATPVAPRIAAPAPAARPSPVVFSPAKAAPSAIRTSTSQARPMSVRNFSSGGRR